MSISARIDIRKGISGRKRRWITATLILTLLISILSIVILMVGNTIYPIKTVVAVLSGETVKGATFAIGTLRLPRLLSGLMVGMAFGFAGSTFQTILRNPLASPDIIGVSAGSSVAAIFCILVLNLSGLVVSFVSVIFGLLVSATIYRLSQGGQFSGGRLILIGIGVQAMLNSVISYMLLKANQYDVPGAMRWLSGSLNTMSMNDIPRLATVVVVFGSITILLGKLLQMLELGEQSAISLGVRTDLTRILLIGSAVVLTAFATAVSGPIAFVAFLSGPIAKRIVGSGKSHALPSALVGALLVLVADFIGQFALGIKLPVGVITGILGAPYLILLLIRMNRTGGAA
ncbi:MAG: iron ABC transporter permease [Clostridiales bacterium]|nr:iron ABC transporter permease [Clostridiales bacterium]